MPNGVRLPVGQHLKKGRNDVTGRLHKVCQLGRNGFGHVLHIGSFVLFALTACQGNEADEPISPTEAGTPITFSGALKDAESIERIRPRTVGSLHDYAVSAFRVYGYKNDAYAAGSYTSSQEVMNAYNVRWQNGRTTTNSDGWEYLDDGQYVKYWDYAAHAYRFFAFAPSTASITPSVTSHTTAGKTIDDEVSFSLAVNAEDESGTPYVSKLWFSTGNAIDYPDRLFGRTVKLEFIKPLARVRILFIYPEGNPLYSRATLSNVRFAPIAAGEKIAKQGTVRISYPLTGTATAESWTSTPAAAGSIESITEDYQTGVSEVWHTVLPRTSQGAYKLSVDVFADTRTATVPAEYMTWQPGYEYTYVFKVTEDNLYLQVVQTAVRNWTTVATDPHELYNW